MNIPVSYEVLEQNAKSAMREVSERVDKLLAIVKDDKGMSDVEQFITFTQAAILAEGCIHEMSANVETLIAVMRIRDLEAKLQGQK